MTKYTVIIPEDSFEVEADSEEAAEKMVAETYRAKVGEIIVFTTTPPWESPDTSGVKK